jgi:GT2 family glycosyltransferase
MSPFYVIRKTLERAGQSAPVSAPRSNMVLTGSGSLTPTVCPEPNALEQLLWSLCRLAAGPAPSDWCLACLPINQVDGRPLHANVLTRLGQVVVEPEPGRRYYPFHVTIWSGCLYRLAAVRNIGLPNPDYVLDWGENEYGHRLTSTGYRAFVDQHAVMKP